jgi:hypothetical protein
MDSEEGPSVRDAKAPKPKPTNSTSQVKAGYLDLLQKERVNTERTCGFLNSPNRIYAHMV